MSKKLDDTLAKLRAEYAGELPGTVEQMEDLWRRLAVGEIPPARIMELVRMAHSVAGSAKTFGLPRATDAARSLELFLDPFGESGRMPDAAKLEAVAALLSALKQAATQA